MPTARPRTAATAGLSSSAMALRKRNTDMSNGWSVCDPMAMKSPMSLPAEKASPSARNSRTRTASSVRARSAASDRAA